MTSWPTITRTEVLARAKQGFGDGLRTVPYSQQRIVGGYRTDCSGYVCRVLGLTEADARAHGVDWWGGMNTVTLVTSGALVEIGSDELRAGDVVGTCGPGTAGDSGHVAIFGGWDSHAGGNYYHIYEQAGGMVGPVYRTVLWGYVRSAYHYAGTVNKEDDLVTTQAQFDELIQGMSKDAREALSDAVWRSDILRSTPGATGDGIWLPQTVMQRLVAFMKTQDPAALATALVADLKAAGVGQAVTDEQLDASLRRVLGSLDEPAAG